MKYSHVVSSSALGIVTRSYHTHWSDVNPIKMQSVSKEERQSERAKLDANIRAQEKRQEQIRRNGGRILPQLFKV